MSSCSRGNELKAVNNGHNLKDENGLKMKRTEQQKGKIRHKHRDKIAIYENC